MTRKRARRFLPQAHAIVVVLALSTIAAAPASAGNGACIAASSAPVQPHRVIVNGPMQQPLPAMSPCAAPQRAPLCAPAKIRTAPPKSASSFPRLIPIEIRDSGPIKPIVAHTVWLAGALIAAPFRLMETVLPLGYISGYSGASAPVPPPGVACVPYGAPPRALPFTGAPFTQAGGGYGQGPSYPMGNPSPSSQENRFPQVEPQSLLGGVVQFPTTMVTQGRILGDLGSSAQCAP